MHIFACSDVSAHALYNVAYLVTKRLEMYKKKIITFRKIFDFTHDSTYTCLTG